MSLLGDRALGVAVGLLLDRALGEPPDALHPVAAFGTAMGGVESVLYRDDRVWGAAYTGVGVGLGAGLGVVGHRVARTLPGGWPVDVAAAVAVASAGRMLRRTAAQLGAVLLADDLAAARERLPWLVGRDPSGLDASGMSAAVVESLAENTVDAVVAPAWWGLVAGAPGVLVHRAANTMDAMVGHRDERYGRFGWASARLDDVLAWIPARVFAGLLAALALLDGTAARQVVRIVRRDAPAHPSPNAGVAESAVAGALGVQLGGPLRYGTRTEDRPFLGDGPRAQPADVAHARRLVDRAELVLATSCLAGWAVDRLLARRRRNARPPHPRRTPR